MNYPCISWDKPTTLPSACDYFVRKSRISLDVRRSKRPFKNLLNGGRGAQLPPNI
nr:MAG TPA: hypothetical protein [Caudoviricetes sp.]DAX71149.1 MAG TPA: hypothetical protein [Caudoviricetes sp.]